MVPRWSHSERKVEASGWSPPLQTMCSLMTVQLCAVRAARRSTCQLDCCTASRCQMVPTHRAQGLATGGEPAAWRRAGLSDGQLLCLCGATGTAARCWSPTSRQAASRDQQTRCLRPARGLCWRCGAAERSRAAASMRPGHDCRHSSMLSAAFDARTPNAVRKFKQLVSRVKHAALRDGIWMGRAAHAGSAT